MKVDYWKKQGDDKIICQQDSYYQVLFCLHACCISAFLALSLPLNVRAQQQAIEFKNIFSDKKVVLHEGDQVHLKFIVNDTADAPLDVAISEVTLFGKIENIRDSSFTLVSSNKMFDKVSVNILVSSIDAFRKYNHFRPVMKIASTIAAGALGILVSTQIATSDQVFTWQNAGLAVRTTSAAYLSRQLFSDKMKYYASEGWRANVIPVNKSFALLSDSGSR